MAAMSLRKVAVAVAALVGMASSAAAQGTPVADRWSGPYLGLMAGAADGHSALSSTVGCTAGGFLCDPALYLNNGALLSATASGSASRVSFSGGAFAGYNWHVDNVVVGIEGDASFLHLRLTRGGSVASLNAGLVNPGPVPVVHTVSATTGVDWVATFRGRMGVLVSPSLLLYGTAGLALTELSVANAYTDNWVFNGGAVGSAKVSAVRVGYALGAGGEWRIAPNWTLRAEYLRIGFDALTASGSIFVVDVPAARNPFATSAGLAMNLFRAGFSHGF